MKIAVWDTYVPRADGDRIMHFDILVPDGTPFEEVQAIGRTYLEGKGESGQPISSSECQYCHSEVASPGIAADIAASGFHVIEMENC